MFEGRQLDWNLPARWPDSGSESALSEMLGYSQQELAGTHAANSIRSVVAKVVANWP